MAINYYSAINLNQNELQFPVIHSAGSAPSSPSAVAGQLYFNSGNAKALYVYDGSNWLTVGQNSISTLAVETTIASGDKLAFSDENQTGDINNALTVDNLFGTGLQHVTEAAVANGDYMLFLDGGATGTAKKEAVADIASLFAGNGLTASNSVIAAGGAADTEIAYTSSDAGRPLLTLKTTHTTKTSSPELQFKKDAADTEDGEVLGQITFYGEDEGNNNTQFAEIIASISESDQTDEAGKLELQVAASDGTDTAMITGLTLEGEHATGSEVDVTIGSGSSSTTTIAGTLTMGSTAAMTNAGLVSVANQSNITGVGTISSGTWQGTAVASAYLDSDTMHLSEAQTITGEKTIQTSDKFYFRDADIYLQSSTDGQLDLVADTEIQIAATTIDINGAVDISGNLDIAQYLRHTGDVNTLIEFGTDVIEFDTGGTSRGKFNNSGFTLSGGASVTTIKDEDNMSSDSATALATQQSIKAYVDSQVGSASVTGLGTITQDTVTFTSANEGYPVIEVKGTHNGEASGGTLKFIKDKGAAGNDGDIIGTIDFIGDDDAQDQVTFGRITTDIADASNAGEEGRMVLSVASHDGELKSGLTLSGVGTEDQVHATIGNTSDSVTTIAGTLTMGSTAALTNAGLVAVANQSGITGLGTISSGVWNGTAVASAYLDSDTMHLSEAQTITGEKTIDGSDKFYFRDSGLYLQSSANGQLDIVADGEVEITAPTLDVGASTAVTIDSPAVTISSSTSAKPVLTLSNTNANATSAELKFNKDTSSGADNDVMGVISFYGTDSSENTEEQLAKIDAIIKDSAHGSEASSMRFYVAENDATNTIGLEIVGQPDDDGEVDVNIGAGAASTTTVAGNLEVTTDLSVAGNLNITGDINSTSVTDLDVTDKTITIAKGAADSAAADGAGIVVDGASASLLYDHTGTQWESNKPFEVTGALTTTAALTADNIVCTNAATFGGGTGSSGVTISTAGAITADAVIKTESTTNATSTTDGSIQTDGGLSVALDVIVGDDLYLLSDSAVLGLGAGKDATFTHDGTTGLTIAATPISIDSTGELHLNSTTGDIKLQDGGTDQITFDLDGTAGEVIMKPAVDSDDFVIAQYDGTEVIRIEDNGSLGLVGNKLSIANSSSDVVIKPLTDAKDIIFQQYDGTEVARVEDNGTFNVVTSKLAINGTAITSTAAELNIMDGNTSATSTTIVDADRVVVNDNGTMVQVTVAEMSTYYQAEEAAAREKVFILDAGETNVASTDDITYEVTHSFGSRNVMVEVYRNGSNSGNYQTVYTDVTRNHDDKVTIVFGSARTAGDYTAILRKIG